MKKECKAKVKQSIKIPGMGIIIPEMLQCNAGLVVPKPICNHTEWICFALRDVKMKSLFGLKKLW